MLLQCARGHPFDDLQNIEQHHNVFEQNIRQQSVLQLHLSDQQFYCLLSCALYECFYGIYFIYSTHIGQI